MRIQEAELVGGTLRQLLSASAELAGGQVTIPSRLIQVPDLLSPPKRKHGQDQKPFDIGEHKDAFAQMAPAPNYVRIRPTGFKWLTRLQLRSPKIALSWPV